MLVFSLVVVTLVGSGVFAEEAAGGPLGGRWAGLFEPRLAANAIRIHNLEKYVTKLKSKIEEAKHADPEKFMKEMEAKLDHVEGNHCAKHEFQCGSDGQECIYDLFMCDGHKDCHNGHDEDPDVCNTSPVKAGNEFSGMVHWTGCLVRDDHPTYLHITGTKRVKFFPARLGVRGVITSVSTDHHGEKHTSKFDVHGGYNFGNRRLVLFPTHYGEHAAHVGLVCEFNHGDDERADCHLLYEASLNECAQLHLTLQHSHHDRHAEHRDDHHDDHHDDHKVEHHDDHHVEHHDDHHVEHHDDHHVEHHDDHHVEHHDDDDTPHVEHHDDDD